MLVLHEHKSRVTLAARLAGKTAAETISVMLAAFARIEPALRKSITFDNDTAFAQHACCEPCARRSLPYAVIHITEFLAQLKREGRLKLKRLADPITYHNPCQISRRGATEDARYLLQDFAQDFREMTPTGNLDWCCGGGGV